MTVAAILKQKGRKVITVGPETSLMDVSRVLAENGIGCIVIVDQNERVVGIVSERDIVRALAQNGHSVLSEPVTSCMTSDVISCIENQTVDEIMAIMTNRRFRHMPVVENGNLIGIVSIGDIVKTKIAITEMEAAAMREYIVAAG